MSTLPPESASTADRLRQAAVELFAERGYQGCSMSDLAERVGIAKASLYNYYPSKEELLLDLVRRSLDTWAAATHSRLAEEGPFEHRLRRYLEGVVEILHRAPHAVIVLRLASSTLPETMGGRVHRLLEENRTRELAEVRAMIERAIAAGEVEAENVDDLLLFGEVFIHGIILSHTACPGVAAPVSERLPGLWRLLWRGLAGRLPEESLRS